MSSIDVIERRIALVEEIRTKWRAIALSTRPLDFHDAEQALYRVYETAGFAFPDRFEFVESPRQGAKLAARYGRTLAGNLLSPHIGDRRFGLPTADHATLGIDGLFSDLEQMGDHLCRLVERALPRALQPHWRWTPPRYCRGSFDSGRLCYEAYKAATARGSAYAFRGQMEAAEECGFWWPYEDICIVAAKPTRITVDSTNRMHNMEGPALLYPDGFTIYAMQGVLMPRRIIEHLDQLTPRVIQKIYNLEQRRTLIEFYGLENYLRESGATLLHEDDFGMLYSLKQEPDEPLVMVKVVNSTPEPDGTYKDYFLRVPPSIRTAREAVAWTFGMEPEEYVPLIQS